MDYTNNFFNIYFTPVIVSPTSSSLQLLDWFVNPIMQLVWSPSDWPWGALRTRLHNFDFEVMFCVISPFFWLGLSWGDGDGDRRKTFRSCYHIPWLWWPIVLLFLEISVTVKNIFARYQFWILVVLFSCKNYHSPRLGCTSKAKNLPQRPNDLASQPAKVSP